MEIAGYNDVLFSADAFGQELVVRKGPWLVAAASFICCLAGTLLMPSSWEPKPEPPAPASDGKMRPPKALSFVHFRSYVVSTVHAIVSVALSVLCMREFLTLLLSGSDSFWTYHSPLVEMTVAVTLGYIGCDTLFALIDHRHFNMAMLVHHVLVLIGFSMGLFARFTLTYQTLIIFNEASTPFVNIHHMFKLSPKLRAINGALMWLAFLLCRLVFNTAMGVSFYFTSSERIITGDPGKWGWTLSFFAAAQVLNLNWFKAMTTGLQSAIRKAKASASGSSSDGGAKAAADEAAQQKKGQ